MRSSKRLLRLTKEIEGSKVLKQLPKDPRLFRYGFVALERGVLRRRQRDALRERGWSKRQIVQISLWSHPEALVQIIDVGWAEFVLLGDVYGVGHADVEERINAVPEGNDAALFALLDELGGRFALLVVETNRARVFHDPVGSQSIFYHDRSPFAVSSHSMLLSAVLQSERTEEVSTYFWAWSLPADITAFRHIYALFPNDLKASPAGSGGTGSGICACGSARVPLMFFHGQPLEA